MFRLEHSLLKRGVVIAVAAAAAISQLSATAVNAGVDPHTSYVGSNLDSTVVVPAVKPKWSLLMDKPADDPAMNEGMVAAGDGKLFLIQGGKLLAVQTKTGKKLWSYGSDLKAPLIYEAGRVYSASGSGAVYSLNAATGKKEWVSNVPSKGASRLYAEDGQLIAMNGDIQAYRLSDGTLIWRDNYKEALPGPLLFAGNRVLASNVESGAYSYTVLHAFDRTTGKEVWSKPNVSFPIAADGQSVTVQRQQTIIDKGILTTLDTLNLQSGSSVRTTEYNPENVDLSKQEFYSPGSAWFSGDDVYITIGSKVYGYPKDADPVKVKKETYTSPSAGGDVRYAAGPYEGRLFYSDGESIFGVKLINKSPVFYNAGRSNPVARFDLIGHGMYIAQTDGKLIAMDLLKAEPVAQLQTYARVFGPTFSADGMIVVQTKGKLLAFPEPNSLKAAK
ncbi:PQQ-like beta-propeller repeat protein [Paenibacillus sp. sptzw28]|uniref:PQQ-binding-like beta-propeller repeat protein n=1 Tax=Paenibacillus sp. sptzw28 TaxID=715179 RepID=UPI001C6DF8CF|nr:PQQ-binding-like beta-propeller repeat protein [Paenibacillus sp. sptzw28]QYR21385.1 PQQ-like beta-propeller repeat protein [Paenibacillus sp. sptzw28]